jgi:hypothetical protein
MRGVIAAATALGITFIAGAAGAQTASTFSTTQSRFVLSAERLFGLSFASETRENTTTTPGGPTTETTVTTTNIGFGTNVLYHSPYVQPQFGFDVFVIDHLSVGTALGYWQASGEAESGGQSRDLADVSLLRVTPRVGYGMMFTDILGLWARGGFTYYNVSTESENGTTSSSNGMAITLDGLLMISPIDHFGIHLGPTFDIGLSGEDETDPADPAQPTESQDDKHSQFGVMAGLSGWF